MNKALFILATSIFFASAYASSESLEKENKIIFKSPSFEGDFENISSINSNSYPIRFEQELNQLFKDCYILALINKKGKFKRAIGANNDGDRRGACSRGFNISKLKKIIKNFKYTPAYSNDEPVEHWLKIPLVISPNEKSELISTHPILGSAWKEINISIDWDAYFEYTIEEYPESKLTKAQDALSSDDIKALRIEKISQNKFETAEEFKQRQSLLMKNLTLKFNQNLNFDYNADLGKIYLKEKCYVNTEVNSYVLSRCSHRLLDNTVEVPYSGKNAFGSEWSWVQQEGHTYDLKWRSYIKSHMDDFLHLPLEEAREHKENLVIYATIAIDAQVPETIPVYFEAEFGKDRAYKFISYHFASFLSEIQIGNKVTGELIRRIKLNYGK